MISPPAQALTGSRQRFSAVTHTFAELGRNVNERLEAVVRDAAVIGDRRTVAAICSNSWSWRCHAGPAHARLSWLVAGRKRHCSMAAIPTIEKRMPAAEPRAANLVVERTRIVNRMKATLARFGIRGFKPTLRAAEAAHHAAHARGRRYRRTRRPNCAGTWRGCVLSVSRSKRSSTSACAAGGGPSGEGPMRWFG